MYIAALTRKEEAGMTEIFITASLPERYGHMSKHVWFSEAGTDVAASSV